MNNSNFKTISYQKALKLKAEGKVVFAIYKDGRVVDVTNIDNIFVLAHKVGGASFACEKVAKEKGFHGIHINKDIKVGKKHFNIYMDIDPMGTAKGGEDVDVFDAE